MRSLVSPTTAAARRRLRGRCGARLISPARWRGLRFGRGGPRDLGRDARRAWPRRAMLAAAWLGRSASACRRSSSACAAGLSKLRPQPRRHARARRSPTSCRLQARDGGFIRAAIDATRRARELRDESRRVIAGLQARYADETGVKSLQVRHNNVLGYFVEVTASTPTRLLKPPPQRNLHPPPDLANAMRFSTAELGELERASPAPPTARWRSSSTSSSAWREARDASDGARWPRRRRWPCSMSPPALAELAVEQTLCARPRSIVELGFAVEGGRHPVVERRCARRRRGASSPTTATLGRRARGRIWLRHRPQHGRQVDLPAPERADRRAGADGRLRAGASRRISASSTGCSAASAPPTISRAAARPSWSRWSRPPRSSIRRPRARS